MCYSSGVIRQVFSLHFISRFSHGVLHHFTQNEWNSIVYICQYLDIFLITSYAYILVMVVFTGIPSSSATWFVISGPQDLSKHFNNAVNASVPENHFKWDALDSSSDTRKEFTVTTADSACVGIDVGRPSHVDLRNAISYQHQYPFTSRQAVRYRSSLRVLWRQWPLAVQSESLVQGWPTLIWVLLSYLYHILWENVHIVNYMCRWQYEISGGISGNYYCFLYTLYVNSYN